MNTLTIIGPEFSTFVKSIELICKYKGLDYQLSLEHEGKALEVSSDSLTKLHPYKKVPILIDEGYILPESNAIARYLEHFSRPSIFHSNPQVYGQIDAWSSMLSIYAFRALISDYIIEIKYPSGANNQIDMTKLTAAQPAALQTLHNINKQLANNHYLVANQFSLADAIALPMLDYHMHLPAHLNLLAEFPNVIAYYKRIHAMPFCKGVLHTF
ncbi:glutathione S-transferase family protein [Pseudoalteromonas sp. MMG012]|uniref:glutathione S-transferase family protein n=1 Tax=Pseudoalteromonas sp. MMG012 TaxID=2822686 RepID=UPI001B3A04DC|nr:glutathione S-transferase family protein [Pseudoalteromonas sp. MMG012]MBQ4850393.1 glutathione S-transferase family protein [Pseudoalteromonas sp. MMG012]